MNIYKLRAIIDHIRRQGKLPTDRWDCVLSPEDLLVWFGLDNTLSPQEQIEIKCELVAMADAEAFMDDLRSVKS